MITPIPIVKRTPDIIDINTVIGIHVKSDVPVVILVVCVPSSVWYPDVVGFLLVDTDLFIKSKMYVSWFVKWYTLFYIFDYY